MPIGEETRKKLIEKIKDLPADKKTKCVALYKLLEDVYAADDLFSSNSDQINFSNHQKLRQLHAAALDVLKGHTQFVPESVPELNEFFTAEELASEEFKTAPVAEPNTALWAELLDKTPFLETRTTPEDKQVLKSLDHVEVVLSEDSPDFKVEFSFRPNDYFTNDKLVLDVAMDEEGEVEEIKSTEVAWKAGKNVTVKEVQKKQKNKKSGQTRTQTTTERAESFFWLFKHHTLPDEEEEDEEEDELNVDPLSDAELFHNAVDISLFFKDTFFTFFLPAYYGVDVKAFAADFMDGGEGLEAEDLQQLQGKVAGAKGQNPQCKQQ